MSKLSCLLICCVFFFTQPDLYALYNPINGTISDATNGDPLVGATIGIEGTNIGTATDIDGNFSLNIPASFSDETIRLVVRYVGFKTQRLSLEEASQSDLTIQLEPDFIGGDEFVVTGQGMNMEKRRLSTNITSITEDEIEAAPTSRLDQILQSKIPNAQFNMTNGQPGSSSIIRARGVVSAFTNSTPIVYVDGVRIDNLNTAATLGGGSSSGAATSALADIPVENIERIEFINGGAATTLYGSDAANGVIQVFTKKTGHGRPQVTFSSQIGATSPTEDFLYFDRTSDLLYQTGLYQKYNVSVSGGEDRFGYSFAGGISDDEGFRISNQNASRKVDFRSGFDVKLSDDFTYRSSLGYTRSDFNRVRNGNAGGYTGLWFAESGASSFTGPGFNPVLSDLSDSEFATMKAFVTRAEELQQNETSINRFQTAQIFEYQPLPNLALKSTLGFDYRVQDENIITTNEYLNHVDALSPENGLYDRGGIRKFNRTFLGLTAEVTGQYNVEIENFSFVTTAGGQFFRDEDHQVLYTGTNVRDGATSISQAATTESNEFLSEVVNFGYYLQENIGFKNRYFVEFGLRGDGNTAFGENVGMQYYPKAGLSYLVSAEPFFLDLFDSSVFSYMKLKANYGVAGNFPQPFAHERTIGFDGFLGEQSATFGQQGNDDLSPEKTYTYEAGADFGFVQDRIQFNLNYYYTETRDALFYVPIAPSQGQGTQLRNVGTIENKGLEMAMTVIPVINQDWDVRVKAAFNTLHNEVTDAGGAGAFNINGFSSRTIQTVVEEGYPIGYLRGNKGTFENGLMTSTEALAFLGSTIPDYFGSVSLDVTYRNLNFFTNGDFQFGAYAHSFDRQFRFNYGVGTEGIPEAEIQANGTSNWLNFTDQFVEKTDFFKVRTIGVNYSFGSELLGNLANSATLGFTIINPLSFASSSFDPEATQSGGDQGQNSATTGGIAYAAESAPRQLLGTFKINF